MKTRIVLMLLLISTLAMAGFQEDCRKAARVCRQTHGLSLVTTTTTSTTGVVPTTTTTSTTTTTTLQYIANPSENCHAVYVPCVYIPDPRTGHLEYFCEYPDTLQCAPPLCPQLPSSPVSAGFP
jgi:hypothetical protein